MNYCLLAFTHLLAYGTLFSVLVSVFVSLVSVQTAGGFSTGEEMWKDVGRYKMILAQMPAKLCYLATEEVLNVMRPILVSRKL